MAQVLVPAGSPGAVTAAGGTSWGNFSGGGYSNSAEANFQVTQRTAGTYSNLYTRINTNATTGASTYTYRLNATNGNQTVSIGSAATGEFTDGSNSDTLSAGDKVNFQMVDGGGGNIAPTVRSILFSASSDTAIRYSAAVPTINVANTTIFPPINGTSSTSSTTESKAQLKAKTAGTLKNLLYRASANNSTTATLRSRVNTANGNLLVSVSSGTSGFLEDTSNSDTIASGDLINLQNATTTTTQIFGTTAAVDLVTTNSKVHVLSSNASGATTVTTSQTTYYGISGQLAANATESVLQAQALVAFTASMLECQVATNTVSATSTVKLRKNAGNGNQSVSITASTTGYFEDASNTDSIVSTDELTYQLATGATGTSMSFSLIGMLADYSGGGGGPTYTLALAQGSYTLTGEAVLFKAARTLSLAQGSYTLTGETAALSRSFPITAAFGSYTLTGEAVAFKASRQMSAAQGSYTLTGEPVVFKTARTLSLAQGSYTLTGEAVTLTYTPNSGAYVMTAGMGSYALTGYAAGLSAPQSAAAGKVQKKRWSVKTGLGIEYFDSAEEAKAFLEGIESQTDRPKERIRSDSKRVVRVQAIPVAKFDGIDVSEVRIKGQSGMNVLREGDTKLMELLMVALRRRIEKEQRDEYEALALILLTL